VESFGKLNLIPSFPASSIRLQKSLNVIWQSYLGPEKPQRATGLKTGVLRQTALSGPRRSVFSPVKLSGKDCFQFAEERRFADVDYAAHPGRYPVKKLALNIPFFARL
jgi:hypothetical protein